MAEVQETTQMQVEQPQAEKRELVVEETDAKRQKTEEESSYDLPAIRKQVEYYFSDQNLGQDAFFHKKISENPEGWLAMDLILSCKKIQLLKADQTLIMQSLKESPLETKVEEGTWVRRTQALPALQPRANNKKQKTGHEGGCIFNVTGVPEGKKWGDVKDVIKVLVPAGSKIVFSTAVRAGTDSCTMLLEPFDGDVEFVQSLDVKIDESKLTIELCQGDALKKALNNMPNHIAKKRHQAATKRNKAQQKSFMVAEMNFPNLNSLRGKVKEILQSRQDGQQLKPDSPDYQLVKAVLEHHPRAAEKLKDMSGLKVDQSPQEGSRCFWVVRSNGDMEDISVKKCLEALDAKTPVPKPQEKKPVEKKDEAKPEEKKDEAKPEEKKDEAKPAEKKDEAKPEEKKEETKPEEKKEADKVEESKPAEVQPNPQEA